jgi:hypothetical protein
VFSGDNSQQMGSPAQSYFPTETNFNDDRQAYDHLPDWVVRVVNAAGRESTGLQTNSGEILEQDVQVRRIKCPENIIRRAICIFG